MAQPKDLVDLARNLALLSDAVAQFLDGTMTQADAARNLHDINAEASCLVRALAR